MQIFILISLYLTTSRSELKRLVIIIANWWKVRNTGSLTSWRYYSQTGGEIIHTFIFCDIWWSLEWMKQKLSIWKKWKSKKARFLLIQALNYISLFIELILSKFNLLWQIQAILLHYSLTYDLILIQMTNDE